MPLVMVAPEEARRKEGVRPDGSQSLTLEYFGRGAESITGAEAFVIEVKDRVLEAHFHPVDQFQILLGRNGSRYQRQEIPPLMLHYADAYSTYGPLSGEQEPLRFFTLRAEPTTVTAFMPADRALLRHRGRRNRHLDPTEHLKEQLVAGAAAVTPLFARESDGLEALLLSGVARATMAIPSTTGVSGQYLYVADGALEIDGRHYGVESLGWIGSGEPGVTVTAGEGGARCILTRFPLPATPVAHENTSIDGVKR